MTLLDNLTFMSAKEIEESELKAESACVVVLNPNGDGSILAITKQKEFGNIGLPGGRIDRDVEETPAAAAVRECLEETGILVEEETLIPVHCALGKSMISFCFLAQKVIGGRLHCMTREGLPMWVNSQALLRDDCTYRKYNNKVISKLIKNNVAIGT